MRHMTESVGLGEFSKTWTPRLKRLYLTEQEFRDFQHNLLVLLVYVFIHTSPLLFFLYSSLNNVYEKSLNGSSVA